ncbi:hypothetical protein CYFUS_008731 [Cystobacter fuscus]|uniref:Putative zinc-finger domain-containing protein n=1 Tax=Cystobacter fuscus TaxID=43 RepID=A0A250JIP0_9BACT|nr:zf-HC2 domain-containing protein [Cystobacter fuscus]ATB43251.1 hypothetical protein CYFUS_008731 [Cystobacter fuscus]
MSTPIDEEIHDRLHAFVDGELEPAEAEAFRDHLGECTRCQEEMEDVLQLQSLGEQLARQQASPPLRTTPRPEKASRGRAFRPVWVHRTWLASAVGVSLAAALLFVLPRLSGSEEWGPEALALGPTRSLEGRLSWRGTSTYRPYAVNRSGNERPTEPVPLKVLARLEEEGDFQGVAAAHLLRGEREQAAEALERAPSTPDADSDRALALLSKGELEAALILLEDVLERDPNHSAALWNRGLVLRELELNLLAAQAFTRVAERNEPGWSTEARERAASLKARTEARSRRWVMALDANKALLEKGTPLPEGTLRDAPLLARESLYLSVWSAPSARRLRELLPLARELDAHYGARVLEPYVERMARRDFRQRGPLAATFSEVLAGRSAPGAAETFIRNIQAAGETDLLLGALPLLGLLPARLDEYTRAARELGDPWFLMDVELRRAEAQFAQTRLGEAEATVLTALPECERQGLDARCGELESFLTHLYTVQHRLVEAREHALHGRQRARATNNMELETRFLQHLSDISRDRGAFALARAYSNEAASRLP